MPATVLPRSITPTGRERPFDPEQIIVSKTDTQGRIRYANDVFLQVSGFAEDELIGRPHSVIRHPDMPMAVFALLWETIAAGHELFAYVVNLAADGGHYWVFAHVTPSFGPDGSIVGYHSNLRWVAPVIRSEVARAYATIRAAEVAGGAGRSKSQRVAAGRAALDGLLVELGLTYDEYVWHLAGMDAER